MVQITALSLKKHGVLLCESKKQAIYKWQGSDTGGRVFYFLLQKYGARLALKTKLTTDEFEEKRKEIEAEKHLEQNRKKKK